MASNQSTSVMFNSNKSHGMICCHVCAVLCVIITLAPYSYLSSQVIVGFETGLGILPYELDGIYSGDLTDYDASHLNFSYGLHGEVWFGDDIYLSSSMAAVNRNDIEVITAIGSDEFKVMSYKQHDILIQLSILQRIISRLKVGLGMGCVYRYSHWLEAKDKPGLGRIYFRPQMYIHPCLRVLYSFNSFDVSIVYSRSLELVPHDLGMDHQSLTPILYTQKRNFFDFRISIPFTRSADELRLGKSKR